MVKPRGRLDAPIVIVGDAPSDTDVNQGQAFSGPTYDLMYDLLGQSDFTIDDCVFVNAVTFQKYEKRGALTASDIRPDADKYLVPFIAQHPRELVIALGNNAVCAVGLEKKPEKVNSHRSRRSESPLLQEKGCHAPVTASLHPWFVLKEPDLDLSVLCDFRYANRMLKADFSEQARMEVRDIKTPEDVQMVWDALKKNPRLAYDFETTDLDRDKAFPVTLSLCNGLKNQKGEFIVWFWCGFDQLRPLYDDETLQRFIEEFDKLFSEAGVSYDLIAWNAAYDDWIAERWVGHMLPGSQFDGMLMKWSIDNRRPHGLKEATARFLGYPNYDQAVDDAIKEIKARRGRILKDKSDLFVLEYFGIEPEVAKTGKKWPKDVDKGLAAFALQPYETLRTYNCYDALYTYLLFEKLGARIDKENLAYSCDFRHRIARELLRCEQRGMLCDVERNREYSARLKDIEEKCEVKIMDELRSMGFDMPEFNHRSGDQLAEVLYGKPVMLPMIDRTSLYKKLGRNEANMRCEYIESLVYGDVMDVQEVREAIQCGHGVDLDKLAKRLRDAYREQYKDEVDLYDEPYYIQGMYRPVGYTKSGKPSTAGAVLQTLYQEHQNPFLALVLMARRANKLRGTFVDGVFKKLDEFYVLRSRFNAIGTETGRISSSNPNGQNFQKNIRGQLVPRPGYIFLEWDLSQAEIRGIAAESGDPLLIAALDASDIHTRIASMVFKIPESEVNEDTHRRYAKTIVFGLIYGMSAYRLSMAINVSIEEAEQFMEDFFAAFPVMKQWLDEKVRQAHRPPFYVYTPWGTRRSTRNVLSIDRGVVSHTERTATNMPIQGGAGELCLWYCCEIMDRIRDAGWDAHMVNTTHDSCTLEVREDLVWEEDLGELDKKGRSKLTICGPIADIVKAVIATPPPVAPLNRVSWKADLSLNKWWSAEPNLDKALDPNLGKEESVFRWDLIRPRDVLDPDEVAELEELEEATVGVSTV